MEKGSLGLNAPEVKVVIVNKNGVRTTVPDLYGAKAISEGIWKGLVEKIEVTQTYKID